MVIFVIAFYFQFLVVFMFLDVGHQDIRCLCLFRILVRLYFVKAADQLKPLPRNNILKLYGEIIAVYSQIHTKHINTLCGQNVELLNVKLAVHIVTTGL